MNGHIGISSSGGNASAASKERDHADRGPIIATCAIRKAYGGNVVLKDVTVSLRSGEVVLLQGDNGSGKTTLLNILTGNIAPDRGTIHVELNEAREEFRFPHIWWRDLNPFDHFTPERLARECVGRTWQDVRLFATQTLLHNIAVATPNQPGESPIRAFWRLAACRRREERNRSECIAMLDHLGLAGRLESSADRISLGQSKRVAIARSIRAGARVLFLDEPLAGLDARGIDDVMSLLKHLAHETGVTLVIVEHVLNIPRVLEIADTVWTLSEGSLKVEPPERVRSEYLLRHGNGVLRSLRDLHGPDAHSRELDLVGGGHLTIVGPRSAGSAGSLPVLELRDLVVRRGKRVVIGSERSDGSVIGLDLAIGVGEWAMLQAPNGWGKTSLLEAIAGIVPIARGAILLNGQPIHSLPIWARVRRGVSVLQSRNHHFDNLTVAESYRLNGMATSSISPEMARLAKRRQSSLSGGEIQRVATECLRQSPLTLYDEPFSALDADALIDFVAQLKAASDGHNARLFLLPRGND